MKVTLNNGEIWDAIRQYVANKVKVGVADDCDWEWVFSDDDDLPTSVTVDVGDVESVKG